MRVIASTTMPARTVLWAGMVRSPESGHAPVYVVNPEWVQNPAPDSDLPVRVRRAAC